MGVAVVDAAPNAIDHLLARAGAVEADSEHPLARAIVAAAHQRGSTATATDFRSLTGRGVRATVDGFEVAVGGPALLRDSDVDVPEELHDHVASWSKRGDTVLYVLEAGEIVGALALADEVRPESRQAVDQLHARGIRVVMITGDSRLVAEAVAADLASMRSSPRYCPKTRTPRWRSCKAAGLQLRYLGVLVFGQYLGEDLIDAQVSRHRLGHQA